MWKCFVHTNFQFLAQGNKLNQASGHNASFSWLCFAFISCFATSYKHSHYSEVLKSVFILFKYYKKMDYSIFPRKKMEQIRITQRYHAHALGSSLPNETLSAQRPACKYVCKIACTPRRLGVFDSHCQYAKGTPTNRWAASHVWKFTGCVLWTDRPCWGAACGWWYQRQKRCVAGLRTEVPMQQFRGKFVFKTLDLFGNCQRPVLSHGVSQHIIKYQINCENLSSIGHRSCEITMDNQQLSYLLRNQVLCCFD